MRKSTIGIILTCFVTIGVILLFSSKTGSSSNATAANTIASDSPNQIIKIAIAAPLTGAYAAFGEQMVKGATQAAKDLNAAGGINNTKIELIYADDACEPKQAVMVASKLIDDDQVDAVVGHFCSSSTVPASEVYADADVIMITPASTNPVVTERNLASILRMCGRDDQQGSVAAEFIKNNLKATRVAVIHDKDTYGQGLAGAVRTKLNQLGITEALYEGLTRGEKDFSALATKIKAINPDAIYFGGMYTEAGPFLRQLRDQGVNAPFISGDGITTTDFITAAGGPQFVNNVYMTFGQDARKLPEGNKIVAEFRATGYEPEGYTLYAYASVQAIAEALKNTNSKSGKALAEYLKSKPMTTIMGNKAWDTKGDLTSTDFVMYKWNTNGTYTQL